MSERDVERCVRCARGDTALGSGPEAVGDEDGGQERSRRRCWRGLLVCDRRRSACAARAGAAESVNDHVSSHRPFRNRQPSAKPLSRVRMRARRNSEPRLVGRLADGTPVFAPLGTLVRDGEERVQCHLCGRFLRMVGGTHLRVGHGWTLDAYREAFELPRREPTCSLDLSNRYRSDAHARLGTRGFGTPPAEPTRNPGEPPAGTAARISHGR